MRGIVLLGWRIFQRDFKTRYRRAYFGALWMLAPTAVLTVVALFIYARLDSAPSAGLIPAALWLISGLVLWGLFSDGLILPIQICRRLRSVLRRVPVSPGAIFIASATAVLLNFALRGALVVVLMLAYRQWPGTGGWSLIPVILGLSTVGLGIGMILAPFSMLYTDIRYSMPLIQSALLLATPILYSIPSDGVIAWINEINPLTIIFGTVRESIFGDQSVEAIVAWTVMLLGLGLAVASGPIFRRSLSRAVSCI